jgi:hypothetical protein
MLRAIGTGLCGHRGDVAAVEIDPHICAPALRQQRIVEEQRSHLDPRSIV